MHHARRVDQAMHSPTASLSYSCKRTLSARGCRMLSACGCRTSSSVLRVVGHHDRGRTFPDGSGQTMTAGHVATLQLGALLQRRQKLDIGGLAAFLVQAHPPARPQLFGYLPWQQSN